MSVYGVDPHRAGPAPGDTRPSKFKTIQKYVSNYRMFNAVYLLKSRLAGDSPTDLKVTS